MGFRSPRSYTLLSVGAAVSTMVIKLAAWRLTGSVGLYSDALESLVNLAAALGAFWALTLAARPADREHNYGHFKAEYFSSGLESALIVLAALLILQSAFGRLLNPQPLQQVGLGLMLSLLATALNGLVAVLLLRASRRFDSITLRADGQHLLTDVWTSLGVVVSLVLVPLTGLTVLDPLVAIAVAANILFTGWQLLRETASGLMDRSLAEPDQQRLARLLAARSGDQVAFHAVRTRVAGSRRFVSLHVLVPGHWSVQRGHDFCSALEHDIAAALPRSHVLTHLEPIEDPSAWNDDGFQWDGDQVAARGSASR
ncbi:cation transporter [Cyanobium sp. LEGE 06143]|uniref:cation diffusion facilitator family transporter n=1 Tax=Cyanobium sp. LEGE 06143 TaxID=945727 RepID=UPI001881178D|nr:cation transporter [Cyanobium sp. LEGE 06143]